MKWHKGAGVDDLGLNRLDEVGREECAMKITRLGYEYVTLIY